jgi:hypothetical protein
VVDSIAQGGPLAEIVRRHDETALDLFLLHRAVATAPPWRVNFAAETWARALSVYGSSAGSTISKVWRRLEALQLVRRERVGRQVSVFALMEDGTGRV